MSRILVVYYSRTGRTQLAAELLAKRLGADLLRITEERSRAGVSGYLRSLWDAARNRDVGIRASPVGLGNYDLVVLGTPVWAGHACAPARTFARRHGGDIERAGLFCTLGGSGDRTAMADLQRDLHHTPLATVAVTDSEIDQGVADFKLASFAAALRARLPPELRATAAA